MAQVKMLIVLQGNKVSFFQKRERYELLTLDGLNEFVCSDSAKEVACLLERFADKLNLESAAGISVSVLSAEGSAVIQPVMKSIREKTSCSDCAELDYLHVLANVMSHLKSDKSLEVDSFGVNYGANSYRIVNNAIQTGSYNLLAYTVSTKLLVEHITG